MKETIEQDIVAYDSVHRSLHSRDAPDTNQATNRVVDVDLLSSIVPKDIHNTKQTK